jgi:hypothetical protein
MADSMALSLNRVASYLVCDHALDCGGREIARDLMLVMGALTVIGEHFDNAAIGDISLSASLDHQFQLGFESRKAANPLLDVGKARPSDAVGGRAG